MTERPDTYCTRHRIGGTKNSYIDNITRRTAILSAALSLSFSSLNGATGAALTSTTVPKQIDSDSVSGDWTSPGLASKEDPNMPKFFKTGGGVTVQDVYSGNGAAAKQGDKVLVDFVLRRSNGYFIYSTVEGASFQPKDVPIGPVVLTLDSNATIPGLVAGIEGMQKSGRRRILVPPKLGYVEEALQPQMPTFATKRQLSNHKKEPLLFEVELLNVIPPL